VGDGGAQQDAKTLTTFRERAAALEAQRRDLDLAIRELSEAIVKLERKLAQTRPDLLPQSAD
jgi:predicted RNase H-like nuclease (RuvC/YqgF family)